METQKLVACCNNTFTLFTVNSLCIRKLLKSAVLKQGEIKSCSTGGNFLQERDGKQCRSNST